MHSLILSVQIVLACVAFGFVSASGAPKPFGFGSQTTGGGSAVPQTPKSLAQLESWLADSVPRVIVIDRTFDFSNAQGNATDEGCAPWPSCPGSMQVQHARDALGWCSQHCQAGHSMKVSYRKSAIVPLSIGSQKTIRGVGKKGIIKGRGLLVFRTSNIIIQNIHITYLNPHLVWGGDALMINGGQNIWVDHCTFSLIGRQMIVVDIGKNIGVTLSNNHFQGSTPWSSTCLGKHYWAVFLTGSGDTITMANNCFDQTSGRSPKVGGSGAPHVDLHYYNNVHTQGRGQSIELCTGGRMLAEGNVFKDLYPTYAEQATTEIGGHAYVPFTPQETAKCQAALGRPCVANQEIDVGKAPAGKFNFGKTAGILQDFKGVSYIKTANVRPTSELLSNGPPGGCGFGNM